MQLFAVQVVDIVAVLRFCRMLAISQRLPRQKAAGAAAAAAEELRHTFNSVCTRNASTANNKGKSLLLQKSEMVETRPHTRTHA